MRRWSLAAAWSLVLVLTTTLAWQIVSAADDRVNDRPVSPLNIAAPVLSTLASTTIPSADTTAPTPTITTGPSPTSTTPSSTTTLSETTTLPPVTTTSTAPEPWTIRSISTSGGVVVVKYRTEQVSLQTATPAPGFTTEVDEAGPPQVKVEFESEEKKIELRARWEDGDLRIDVSEDEHDS